MDINIRPRKKVRIKIPEQQLTKIVQQAANRAQRTSHKYGTRRVMRALSIKRRKFVPLVKLTKANRKQKGNPVARSEIKGRPLPMVLFAQRAFKPSKSRRGGLAFRVRGKTQRIEGAFIVKDQAVVRDRTKGQLSTRPGNLNYHSEKLRVLYGPTAWAEYQQGVTGRTGRTQTAVTFRKNLKRLMRRELIRQQKLAVKKAKGK